jgi:6-pyruvoyltetrahydropterin/6-carboxytetrahydropterin synthase
MFTIRKKFRVEMAHQLFSAFSAACHETIHGHSYVIEIVLGNSHLNRHGMVVDFGTLQSLKEKLMEEYDHALFMPVQFPQEYLTCLGAYNKKLRVIDTNPTAEWMAVTIFADVQKWIAAAPENDVRPSLVRVIAVRVHETETGWAQFGEEGEADHD